MTHGVMVVNSVRTTIGTSDDSLKDMTPCELGVLVVHEALAHAGVKGEDVGHVVFDHVVNTGPHDMYLSYVAAINGGVSAETPAFNVNRLYGSSLQAVVSAAQTVLLNDADVAIAGGAESMNRAPYLTPAARWGSRVDDAKMADMMLGVLHDLFHMIHMGVTAENATREFGISYEQQDQTTLESHQRASCAMQAGHFKDQIIPVTIKSRKDDVQLDTNEHVRHDATIGGMTKLKPVFTGENDTVMVGNTSDLNNAGAALVLMERSVAEKHGLKPLVWLVSYGHAGVGLKTMGIGPVPATRKTLERAGLSVKDLDVIEADEIFATQACAITRELGLDPVKVNSDDSNISLGHPIGATGVLITVKALHKLWRIGGCYALVTICIGGGQGIAAVFERI